MQSKTLTINDTEITVHADGSISKPDRRFKDNRIKRKFGSRDSNGYMVVVIGRKMFKNHRVTARAFFSDYSEDLEVDHVNGIVSDNRIENLRMATSSENNRAYRSKPKNCSSRWRGVCQPTGSKKWLAQCQAGSGNKYIGMFDNERDAAIAYDAYAYSQGFSLEALNFKENY
tara:strand:- start:1215 stop:1730 length:516 start_codon:yes stop_codon:yes gene_type:complete